MNNSEQSQTDRIEAFARNFVASLSWLQSSMPLTTLGLALVGIPLLLIDDRLTLSKTGILVVFVIIAIDSYHGFRRERKILRDQREVLIERLSDTGTKGKGQM